MDKGFIRITEFCKWYKIERTFIRSLHEHGLVEIVEIDQEEVLTPEQIADVEKMIRLHYDLKINIEGIDAVYNLLNQVSDLQGEVRSLRSRLKKYED